MPCIRSQLRRSDRRPCGVAAPRLAHAPWPMGRREVRAAGLTLHKYLLQALLPQPGLLRSGSFCGRPLRGAPISRLLCTALCRVASGSRGVAHGSRMGRGLSRRCRGGVAAVALVSFSVKPATVTKKLAGWGGN